MAYRGVRVRIPTVDDDGRPDGNYETAVFGTARGKPGEPLKEALRAVIRAEIADTKAAKAAQREQRKLLEAGNDDDLEALAGGAEAAVLAAQEAEATLYDAVWAFVVAGFRAGGYTAAEAERYAAMIEPDRLPELKAAAQLGCGTLDFTKAPKGAG